MIYLLRHTKPEIAPNICYGQSDIGLCGDFYSQHLLVVLDSVSTLNLNKVYSSPLYRCHILAAEIVCKLKLSPVVVDRRLMEMNFGDWELQSWDFIFKSKNGKCWFDNYLTQKCPNGESFSDMIQRAHSFLEEIMNEKEDILVVTHAGFIRAIMVAAGKLTKNNMFEKNVEYGQIIELDLSEINKSSHQA